MHECVCVEACLPAGVCLCVLVYARVFVHVSYAVYLSPGSSQPLCTRLAVAGLDVSKLQVLVTLPLLWTRHHALLFPPTTDL